MKNKERNCHRFIISFIKTIDIIKSNKEGICLELKDFSDYKYLIKNYRLKNEVIKIGCYHIKLIHNPMLDNYFIFY